MVFTNAYALEESPTNESGNASQPLESRAQPRDEPEEVVVHTQPSPLPTKKCEPVTEAQDEMPLLSAIKDYEDGKKADESKCAFDVKVIGVVVYSGSAKCGFWKGIE